MNEQTPHHGRPTNHQGCLLNSYVSPKTRSTHGARTERRSDHFLFASESCFAKFKNPAAVEASAPSRRPLPREDSDATGTAHDALLGTERSQGHRTSTLGCLDECQPGSGWHARCDCVAVAASHGCSADEATHHQKQVPRLPSKRARHFYPRR